MALEMSGAMVSSKEGDAVMKIDLLYLCSLGNGHLGSIYCFF